MRLSFDINRVREIREFIAANTPAPCVNDLFNQNLYPGGKVVKKDGWPDSEAMDHTLLEPRFFLVKDQGVYLMPGTKEFMRDPGRDGTSHRSVVAYANGLNPETDVDWYDEAEWKLGGDDFALSIPASWFDHLLKVKPTATRFVLKMTKRGVSLIV